MFWNIHVALNSVYFILLGSLRTVTPVQLRGVLVLCFVWLFSNIDTLALTPQWVSDGEFRLFSEVSPPEEHDKQLKHWTQAKTLRHRLNTETLYPAERLDIFLPGTELDALSGQEVAGVFQSYILKKII